MADVELLPLPAIERWEVTGDYAFPTATDPEGHAVDYDAHVDAMQSYARACVEANLAPLQAEVETLRAEVELWRHKAAVHQYRRKRLAEALRDARDCAESHLGLLIVDNMSDGVEQTKALITKIDAALAQEDRNG